MEIPRRVNDIISTVDRAIANYRYEHQKPKPQKTTLIPNLSSPRIQKILNKLPKIEKEILINLGFEITTCSPHQFLISITPILQLPQNIVQHIWEFINDSAYSIIGIRYPPEIVCLSIITIIISLYTFTLPVLDIPLSYIQILYKKNPTFFLLNGIDNNDINNKKIPLQFETISWTLPFIPPPYTLIDIVEATSILATLYGSSEPNYFSPLSSADSLDFDFIDVK